MAFEPHRIKRPHIIAAINRIEREKRQLRSSTGYDVIINEKRYPPKEIVRISYEIATGTDPGKIYGGEQTNSILRNLIVEKWNTRQRIANDLINPRQVPLPEFRQRYGW